MTNYNPPTNKTPAEVSERIVEAYLSGTKVKDICNKYAVSETRVPDLVRRAGHTVIPNRSRSAVWLAEHPEHLILDSYQAHRSVEKVAKQFGISHRSVSRILRENDIYFGQQAIIDDAMAAFLRAEYTAGASITHLATAARLSEWVIGKYLRAYGYDTRRKSLQAGFSRYVDEVRSVTRRMWYTHRDLINPLNLARGQWAYHIDHIFSLSDGFKEAIDPSIVGHYTNLQMVWWQDNIRKGSKSCLTVEALLERYEGARNWDRTSDLTVHQTVCSTSELYGRAIDIPKSSR